MKSAMETYCVEIIDRNESPTRVEILKVSGAGRSAIMNKVRNHLELKGGNLIRSPEFSLRHTYVARLKDLRRLTIVTEDWQDFHETRHAGKFKELR